MFLTLRSATTGENDTAELSLSVKGRPGKYSTLPSSREPRARLLTTSAKGPCQPVIAILSNALMAWLPDTQKGSCKQGRMPGDAKTPRHPAWFEPTPYC